MSGIDIVKRDKIYKNYRDASDGFCFTILFYFLTTCCEVTVVYSEV